MYYLNAIQSQRASLFNLCNSKEKVISTKEEEIRELVKVIESFKDNALKVQCNCKQAADSSETSKLTSEIEALKKKLHIATVRVSCIPLVLCLYNY